MVLLVAKKVLMPCAGSEAEFSNVLEISGKHRYCKLYQLQLRHHQQALLALTSLGSRQRCAGSQVLFWQSLAVVEGHAC